MNRNTEAPSHCNPMSNEGYTLPLNDVEGRSEGGDSAKHISKGDVESSSSAAYEVLQRIHDSREKSQRKEDEQLKEILCRKDEKLNLQREILKLHVNEIEMKKEMHQYKKKQTREEHIQLRKQENELLAKQAEAQLLTTKAGIMAIYLEKVAPHLKDYYIEMQRQIMERRGFTPSNNNNS
jgi:hypothetical protein